jgi:hypothetical protein
MTPQTIIGVIISRYIHFTKLTIALKSDVMGVRPNSSTYLYSFEQVEDYTKENINRRQIILVLLAL